jgi:leucine dehydrogenase
MNLFTHPEFDGHEQVAFFHDQASGLRAIIAVHDTTLGPSLGGVRMAPYDGEAAALTDALRLARGMTYKSALAGLDLGGGKAVIIGDPRRDKSRQLMHAMGRAVDRLAGRYVAAEDAGTCAADLLAMAEQTTFVGGIADKPTLDGGVRSGDPSPATARGCLVGIRAAVRHALGRGGLEDVRVAVQGLGSVGGRLARLLAAAGAQLVVTDVDHERARGVADATGATAVAPESILAADVDVLAPCAMGAVIDDLSVSQMRARIVAGAANNQLAEPRHGHALAERGILYAPDYVINAGGVIDIAHERAGFVAEAVAAHIDRIGDTLAEIFERSAREERPTSAVADALARSRLRRARLDLSRAA